MKTHLKSCRKQSKGTQIYRLSKYGRWRSTQQDSLPSVDYPVDRPTVKFLTVVPTVDRPVDRGLKTESRSSLPVDRPVDRGLFQRAELSGGRPALQPNKVMHICAHRSTARSTDLWLDRPCGRPAEGQNTSF